MQNAINRRDLLKLASATFLTLQLPAAEPQAPLYFTKDEFALLDRLTDLIIPADDHSPGAHEAGVAAYIDRTVAEAFLAEEKDSWRKGLAAVNDLAQTNNRFRLLFLLHRHPPRYQLQRQRHLTGICGLLALISICHRNSAFFR